MNNRQNGRRRGRGGQQARSGQPGSPDRGSRLDNRARGNAAQLYEKYKTLARDTQMQGDRVNTEYYLQFADHYFRVLSENRSRFEEQRPRRDDMRDEFGADDGGEPQRGYQQRDDADDWDDEDGADSVRPPEPQQRTQRPRRDQPSYQADAPVDRQGGDRGGNNGGANGRSAGRNGNGNGGGAGNTVYAPPAPPVEDTAPARIEIDLPPALSVDSASDAEAAPKRRRVRKPRAETAPSDA